ncbi:unnamed protein product [Soboliphyme baturini]|uniref:WD_REPEATS_REGION domain-containing protein n=1 Tax=Soboliphyme baturini TaxID=241478 RepID=A0A183IRS3_9BILA|nr:unnamed protein product [Soboliphyme baturini]
MMTTTQTVLNEAEIHIQYAMAHKPIRFLDVGHFMDRVKTCLIVQGSEGSGKSAFICELTQRLLQWLSPRSHLIVRFVGLTPQSTQLHELFRSICLEICMKFIVSEKVKEPLLILIDDVHMLKEGLMLSDDQQHLWLPLLCDPGIIIIITTGDTLKQTISAIIEERMCDGRTVMTWSHAFIGAVVRHRYLISSGECDIEEKSLDRCVQTVHASSNKYNAFYIIPQVRNLWYHLLHTGSIDNLESVGFCNFEYLYKTVLTTGIFHMRTTIEGALLQVLNYNLHVLYTMVLRPSFKFLYQDPNLLAGEVILRLSYDRKRNTDVLNRLLDQAMLWVDTCCCFPLIVPLTSWIRPCACPLVSRFRLKEWSFPTVNYQHLLVAGAVEGGKIWMYHIASHRLIRSFAGHNEQVIFLKTSTNGRNFVSGSCEGVVKVWDVYQDNCVVTFKPHSGKMCSALFSFNDEDLFTGYSDGVICMTTVQNGSEKCVFRHHMGPVTALSLTSENDYLVSGSADFTVAICYVETGAVISKLLGLMAPVKSIALTSNDVFALISCEDESLKVFSICTSSHIKELQGHGGKICSLAVAHDDCQAFAGSSDGKIYCYDLHSGTLMATQSCDTYPVTSLKVRLNVSKLFLKMEKGFQISQILLFYCLNQ